MRILKNNILLFLFYFISINFGFSQQGILFKNKDVIIKIEYNKIVIENKGKKIIEQYDEDIGYIKNGNLYGIIHNNNDSLVQTSSLLDEINQILYLSVFDEFYRGRLIVINLSDNFVYKCPLESNVLHSKTSIYYIDVFNKKIIIKSSEKYNEVSNGLLISYNIFRLYKNEIVFCNDILLEEDVALLNRKLFDLTEMTPCNVHQ